MTQTLDHERRSIFFPASLPVDPDGLIVPAPFRDLATIAAAVHPDELMLFTKRLVDGAKKRRRVPRYAMLNRRRLQLARLCIDRALAEMFDGATV